MSNHAHQLPTRLLPGAAALLGSSIVARLPLAMFSLALLVHAQRLTGSFTVAGLVAGAYAVASAVAAPLLGGVVDHRGQTWVLVCGATLTALVLLANGLTPAGTPTIVLIVLGAATGLSTPPLAACVRTLLPAIVADQSRLPALFALESTLLELTFVAGPPLALGLGTVWSPGAALIVSGSMMLAGTLGFAAQPPSRHWRPQRQVSRPRGGSLRSPAIRTLVVILLGTGAAFGATEVGVTAAAHALGSSGAAGPLLGLWGVGSLLGGIVATRMGGGARSGRGLILLLAALALGHGALTLTTGSLVAIGIVITLAGATIAPAVSSIYAMVDATAPAGTQTEAFSWLLTASLVGASLGSAAAGVLAQAASAQSAFALVAATAGLAAMIALLRSRTLDMAEAAGRRQPVADMPLVGGSNRQSARATRVANRRFRASQLPVTPPQPEGRKTMNEVIYRMALSRRDELLRQAADYRPIHRPPPRAPAPNKPTRGTPLKQRRAFLPKSA